MSDRLSLAEIFARLRSNDSPLTLDAHDFTNSDGSLRWMAVFVTVIGGLMLAVFERIIRIILEIGLAIMNLLAGVEGLLTAIVVGVFGEPARSIRRGFVDAGRAVGSSGPFSFVAGVLGVVFLLWVINFGIREVILDG